MNSNSNTTFEFEDDSDDQTSLTFRVVDSWENRYGDIKAAVETPAPWDTPDEVTPANEVVKTLEWDDFHYNFDEDREAWTLDKDGLRPLAEAAEEAGYEWEGMARDDAEDDDEDETLVALCEAAEEGDHVAVTYAKKNGNGNNTYEGTVETAVVMESAADRDGWSWEKRANSTRTTGIVFTDTDGKTKKLKADDDGTPALFSSGYYPFMGTLVSVEVSR